MICIWSSWCHCYSIASLNSRMVYPFWCRLTQVVLEERLLNGCLFVCKFRLAFLALMFSKVALGAVWWFWSKSLMRGRVLQCYISLWQNLTGQRMTCACSLTVYWAVDKNNVNYSWRCFTKHGPHASGHKRALLSPRYPRRSHNGPVSCCTFAAYGARVTMLCQWGWLGSFHSFVPGDLELWPWHSNSSERGTKHVFPVISAQIRSAVPEIFEWQKKQENNTCHTTTTTPQPFYGHFSRTTRVSQCQKRTSGLYGARGD